MKHKPIWVWAGIMRERRIEKTESMKEGKIERERDKWKNRETKYRASYLGPQVSKLSRRQIIFMRVLRDFPQCRNLNTAVVS